MDLDVQRRATPRETSEHSGRAHGHDAQPRRSDRRGYIGDWRRAGYPLVGATVALALVAMLRVSEPPPRPLSPTHDPGGGLPEDVAAPRASVVRTIASSKWFKSSPDPSGIAYQPASGTFVVVDSEVDETRLFRGSNVWMADHRVHPKGSWSTTAFSSEPSDVAVAPRRTLIMTD